MIVIRRNAPVPADTAIIHLAVQSLVINWEVTDKLDLNYDIKTQYLCY